MTIKFTIGNIGKFTDLGLIDGYYCGRYEIAGQTFETKVLEEDVKKYSTEARHKVDREALEARGFDYDSLQIIQDRYR